MTVSSQCSRILVITGSKIQQGAVMLPAGPVTLPADWTGPGTIALVSHPSQGSIMVIQTEGTQIVTDSTGNSILSLDVSSIGIPYSIPVSISGLFFKVHVKKIWTQVHEECLVHTGV